MYVMASAHSFEPFEKLDSSEKGKAIRQVAPSGDHYTASIDETVEVDRGGWIAARAHGRKMLEYGATWWKMPVFAHSSPIYRDMPGRPAPAAESARLFLDQLGFLERWAERDAKFPLPENKSEALRRIAQAREVYRKLSQSMR